MAKQSEIIQSLLAEMKKMKEDNLSFRENLSKIVLEINRKVEREHQPLHFEAEVVRGLQQNIAEAVKRNLENYNNPLRDITNAALKQREKEIETLFLGEFDKVLKDETLQGEIGIAIRTKLARSIVSMGEGVIDNLKNELLKNPLFKAKAITAIDGVVEQFMKGGDEK